MILWQNLTVKFEVFLTDVGDDAAEVGAVVAEKKISVLDDFRHSAVDELARRFTSRPGTARRATSGQDARVAHRRAVLALQDEPSLAAILQGAADAVGVLLIGLGPDHGCTVETFRA